MEIVITMALSKRNQSDKQATKDNRYNINSFITDPNNIHLDIYKELNKIKTKRSKLVLEIIYRFKYKDSLYGEQIKSPFHKDKEYYKNIAAYSNKIILETIKHITK